jgi:hypothetical protein
MSAESDFPTPEHLRNDEVAARTTWAPLQPKESASYRTLVSNRQSEHRLTFDPTRTSKIAVLCMFVCSAISLVLVFVITYLWLSGTGATIVDKTWVLILAGAIFLQGGVGFGVIGFILKSKLLQSIVFDRQVGRYWRGSTTPTDEHVVALTDIHALQIIEKWVKPTGPDSHMGRTPGYSSFELNLVTTDGLRHNVVDHGDLEALREDAESLCDFLQIPLWDASCQANLSKNHGSGPAVSMQHQRKSPALVRFLLPYATDVVCPDCDSKIVMDARAPIRRVGFFVFPAFFSVAGLFFAFFFAFVVSEAPVHPIIIFLFFAIGGSLMSVVFLGIIGPLFLPRWICRQCRKRWR